MIQAYDVFGGNPYNQLVSIGNYDTITGVTIYKWNYNYSYWHTVNGTITG